MNTEEIVARLNEIEETSDAPGQNSAKIWEYIQKLDEWDESKTDEVDPSWTSARFALTDGTVIVWDEQRKVWHEQS